MPDLVKFPSKKPARKQKRRILSATTLKALTPPPSGSVDYFDDRTPGLSLRVTANDVRTYTFRAEQRLVPPTANPVIGVKKPTKETTRDRVLTEDEIRRLWEACATQNPYVCAWFRLRLVTAQRGGELLQMRWSARATPS